MPLSFGATGRGGAWPRLRNPPDEFTGGTLAEAVAARDHAMTGITDTSQFDADPNLAVILTATDPDPDETYFFVRRGGAWADVTNVARGARGPGPTAAQVTAGVQAGVKSYARIGSADLIPDSDIPGAITRDSEITASAIVSLISGEIAFADIAGLIADGQVPADIMRDLELTLARTAGALGLTTTEVEQLLVGAPTLSGRDLTFTLSDGTAVTRTLPEAGGTADGRLRFGVGDPAAALGIDGDTYVDLSTGEAWERIAGAWTEHGTFSFTRLVAMSRTRYAAQVADNANPTEAEWLAGNTSETDHINQPPRAAGEYDAFAIPSWQTSLTDMMQAAGIFNERGLFDPAQNEDDVVQTINAVECKTYIRSSPGGARASVQAWILRPAPP